ncbi:MAG: hypothetical protein JWM11_3293, partial [Planctomycetaceae bacterium]|nr:hypothetical protein [Planctomycetaceae bacterium]
TAGTVGGILQTLREHSVTVRPLLVASACPSGPLTLGCYEFLKQDLLARLQASMPVSGVLLALHGSAAVEVIGDLEGDLLTAVRDLVGPEVPIVATLDLHAHVTREMVLAADVLVAWETYPHRDAFETGVRGALAILDMLSGRLRPTMALAKVPVLVGGVMGHTEGVGPFADVMRLAKSMERRPEVYSTSAFLVHPYLDLPEMGGGGLVVTHDNMPLARELAGQLAELYWKKRFELEPAVWIPEAAIRRGLEIQGGPILLIETADCCGGGAAGDSAATLKSLLELAPDQPSLVPIVDPQVAVACHQAGKDAEITVALGHHVDPDWGTPVVVTGTVRELSAGEFTYRGGIWEGQTGQMGLSACLQVGGIQIAVGSHATYEWNGEQYELLGMDARLAKFVVVKNPMNYRMTYGEMARGEFLLETPGPTPASLKNVKHHRVARPYFPADQEIAGLKPMVYCRLE